MSIKEYHKSTSKELLAVKDRVRYLINHWGEDGRYKEAVLKSIISRFLPEKFNIGTGFVVKHTNYSEKHQSSPQIDLIVYDTSFPVLFKEGDFVILTPDAVNAIIEVKANLRNQNISKVLKKANEIGEFIFMGKRNKTKPFFNGIFSYKGYEKLLNALSLKPAFDYSKTGLNTEERERYWDDYIVNHIAFNKNIFYKYWGDQPDNVFYKIEDLTFAYFISNLIDYVSVNSVIDNIKLWFPINKNINKIGRF
jgi:hypothetical protein